MVAYASVAHTWKHGRFGDSAASTVDLVSYLGSSYFEDAASSSDFSCKAEEDMRSPPRAFLAASGLLSF